MFSIRFVSRASTHRNAASHTKSKQHLSELVAGRLVTVEYDKRDRYERIVGKVLVGRNGACLAQVSAGYAWHYKKYQGEQTPADRKRYAQAEI
jgi:endonuclease YncB( thermonuclease family)